MRRTGLYAGLLSAASMISASVVPTTAQAQDSFAQIQAAEQRGDYATAAALTKYACDQGNPQACHNLGLYYQNGQGVPHDDAQAAALFKRACDGGEPAGCAGLGNLYLDGKGVARDPAEAIALDRRACDGGEPVGCESLGVIYSQGLGVPKDYGQSAIFSQRACELGNAEGCRAAGIFYVIGQGVEQDFNRSIALLDRGCKGGDATSCSLIEKVKSDAAAAQAAGGGSGGGSAGSTSAVSTNGDVFGQCVRLEDLGQSGIQHMWQLRNVCSATIKVAYCFQEIFAAAGDTNMCDDSAYDHRTIASGATFDFPFTPLPDGTSLSDGRVVKNNEFRVAGFACANGSAPDVYFDSGKFRFQHC